MRSLKSRRRFPDAQQLTGRDVTHDVRMCVGKYRYMKFFVTRMNIPSINNPPAPIRSKRRLLMGSIYVAPRAVFVFNARPVYYRVADSLYSFSGECALLDVYMCARVFVAFCCARLFSFTLRARVTPFAKDVFLRHVYRYV